MSLRQIDQVAGETQVFTQEVSFPHNTLVAELQLVVTSKICFLLVLSQEFRLQKVQLVKKANLPSLEQFSSLATSCVFVLRHSLCHQTV